MNRVLYLSIALPLSFICSCDMMIAEHPKPTLNERPITERPVNQRVVRSIVGFFPFEDNANKWNFTEAGGNTVVILVTDTISDDGNMYFRVSFRENRVDTTDDWFLKSPAGIYFGQSLTGEYDLFLPAKVDSACGRFKSAGSTVEYTFSDSLLINGFMFHRVLHLRYNIPIIHGFDEVTLADSIGIVELVDHNGRWPIVYAIDSCRIGGSSKLFY